jgi:hypothetical protein
MSAMFKAVVWKELRQNLKWAVVILLGMAAFLAYAIPSLDELLRGQSVDINGIFNTLDATTAIGGLLAGLLLGAAQTLVENRGDKWGFLVHRPISRTALFWGKATAGIMLYVLSTVVPVAIALFRIASPEYLPVPFDWRVALPAIANLLCGLVFYFAGLLTVMRQAKWYASRTLGIGAAFCCFILQGAAAREFWQAVAICATGLILVGTAAWSTFVASGQYGTQPRIGRIVTGASIGLGLTIVAGLVFAAYLSYGQPQYQPPAAFPYIFYTVTSDGVVARVRTDSNHTTEVTDLIGRPLVRDRSPAADVATATLSRRPWAPTSFRSTVRLFSQLRRPNAGSPGWYYVHRLGLLAAYDGESRKLIGWLGPNGFSPGGARPLPFAGQLNRASGSAYGNDGTRSLLVFEDAVYRLDLDKRHVEKIFQAEPAETIMDVGSSRHRTSPFADMEEGAKFEVISTTRRVIVQLRDGTKVLAVPHDASALHYAVLQVSRALHAPGAPTFIWYRDNSGGDSRISEFNGAGTVVNSWTLPATTAAAKEPLSRVVISAAAFPLINPTPVELIKRLGQSEPNLSRPPETARWAVAILSSLISAAAAFLHGRRYAFPAGRLTSWTVVALLLGPLGYLLMLALIEWPAREPCPACRKKRVVTREHCEHCGEPFAAPPKDGTEIFEPALV